MSIWHPKSGMTYEQYLQTDSFVRDVTGQIKTSSKRIEASSKAIENRVSEQTKSIVAGQEELAREFGKGFDRVNGTLQWGFNRVADGLDEIDSSIQSLHADFNYNMSLCLEQMQAQTGLLSTLVDKLDAINKTLESPTLTQAREYYKIGQDRLAKGLLDKALEAFGEAEKKNDTDFFTQFEIGRLYLYGIDDDDNVQDLEKAKHHLLLAARYAKAEVSRDPNFARLAAEALLHASISLYAKLGEGAFRSDTELGNQILEEARVLAKNAIALCPDFSEARYHIAKYSALLGDEQPLVRNLEASIQVDRNYAVKVDLDGAFDSLRPQVTTLLTRLCNHAKTDANSLFQTVRSEVGKLTAWYPNEGTLLQEESSRFAEILKQGEHSLSLGTYFGYLDSIQLFSDVSSLVKELQRERIEKLRSDLRSRIATVSFPTEGSEIYVQGITGVVKIAYSDTVKRVSSDGREIRRQAENLLTFCNYTQFEEGMSLANIATEHSEAAWKYAKQEENTRKVIAKSEVDQAARINRRTVASKKNGVIVGKIGAILGFVIGLGVFCANFDGFLGHVWVCGFPFVLAAGGGIAGYGFGWILGQAEQ